MHADARQEPASKGDMSARERVRVVRNAKSGGGRVSSEQICAEFRELGCGCALTELGPGVDLPKLAAADGEDVAWIAAGGDGTVNAVASAIGDSGRAMGVLPAGTLNHFARDLRLPGEINGAMELAVRGNTRAVDAAEVNGVRFVNCSSLGIYPEMVAERDRIVRKSRWTKWAAMLWASAKAFVRFRRVEVDVEVNGTMRRCRTPLLFVGNNKYAMDGQGAGGRKRLDGGCLTVVIAPGLTRLGVLRILFGALFGKLSEVRGLETLTVRTFRVQSHKKRLRVAMDGEVRRMVPPLDYCVRPGALRVIAPPLEAKG